MNAVTHHVVMPLSRPENIGTLREHYRSERIVWHPVSQEEYDFGDEDWIRPFYCKVPKYYDPCYYKLNAFNEIVDLDYYSFLCDDDMVIPGHFDRLRKHRGEVILSEAAMPQPIIPADKGWMRIGACTLGQLTVRGDIYRSMVFTNEWVADGRMIEKLVATRRVEYAPECRVLHNRLEPGRWRDDDPANNFLVVNIGSQREMDEYTDNWRLNRYRTKETAKI